MANIQVGEDAWDALLLKDLGKHTSQAQAVGGERDAVSTDNPSSATTINPSDSATLEDPCFVTTTPAGHHIDEKSEGPVSEDMPQEYKNFLQEYYDDKVKHGLDPELVLVKRRPFPGKLYLETAGGDHSKWLDNVYIRLDVQQNTLGFAFQSMNNPESSAKSEEYRQGRLDLSKCLIKLEMWHESNGFDFIIVEGRPTFVVNDDAPAHLDQTEFEKVLKSFKASLTGGSWAADVKAYPAYTVKWGVQFWIEHLFSCRHDVMKYAESWVSQFGVLLKLEHETQKAAECKYQVNASIVRNAHQPAHYNLSFVRPADFRGSIGNLVTFEPEGAGWGKGPSHSLNANIPRSLRGGWCAVQARVNDATGVLTYIFTGVTSEHTIPNECVVTISTVVGESEYKKAMFIRLHAFFKMLDNVKDIKRMANNEVKRKERAQFRIGLISSLWILLVCGAPGTGKTFFLAKLACHAVAVMNWKVLICAPTNQAADVCTHALLSTAAVDKVMIATEGPKEGFTNMEVVRLLAPSRDALQNLFDTTREDFGLVNDLHRQHDLSTKREELALEIMKMPEHSSYDDAVIFLRVNDEIKKNGNLFGEGREVDKGQWRRVVKNLDNAVIEVANVVIATNYMATCKTLLNCNKFQLVCNDEVPVCRGDQALGPIVFNENLMCYVGVGDENQSLPFVMNENAKSSLQLNFYRKCMDPARKFPGTVSFTQQHRMEAELMDFVNRAVYNNKLVVGKTVRDGRPYLAEWTLKMLKNPITLWQDTNYEIRVDTNDKLINVVDGIGQADGRGSTYNVPEALAVVEMVKSYIRSGFEPKFQLVICAYVAQRDLIKGMLAKSGIAMDVISIDSSLGVEREIVHVVCSRGGEDMPGFLMEMNRVNVALTRAKYDRNVFVDANFWMALSGSSLLGAFCYNMRSKFKITNVKVPEWKDDSFIRDILAMFPNVADKKSVEWEALGKLGATRIVDNLDIPAPEPISDVPISISEARLSALKWYEENDYFGN
ncbi:P-loop containing nucleoside triphosphate hydrolase protein [Leptodontidium sp. 2 PMI_412]|nr:P-loop containing nucleoside triphosphate hydrolase protein [Leptodontidium sp. 2 PMI_412]